MNGFLPHFISWIPFFDFPSQIATGEVIEIFETFMARARSFVFEAEYK